MLENEGVTPEVEQIEKEIVEPKSMDDTIRETLRNLSDRGVEVEKEVPQDAVAKSDRIRDENGKYAVPVVGESQSEVVTKPAPNTWRKEVQEKWSTLPPEVQSEVERREADFHKGIEQYKSQAQFAQSIEKSIAPYAATLQSLNISPDRAVAELLGADHVLRYGSPADKMAKMAQFAQAYNIDLGQVQQPQQQTIDPNLAYFQQKIQALEGMVHQQTMMGQQKESESLNNEIANFSTDPSHNHFESVKSDMAALLQGGLAKDLQDAYEQAIWRNPSIRTQLLAEQQAQVKNQATQKAQAAKAAASVNVRARPSMPVSQPIGTMDDTIRATLRRLQS